MKVTRERLPESRVLLDIEVDPERLEQSLDAEYRRFATRAKIPGFRPGKAPRAVIERAMGGPQQLRTALIDDSLKHLVPDVYNEVIKDEDVDAIAQPELEIVELDPVRFKATVPVRPTVELNDYRSIRIDKETVEVTDEMVAEQVMGLRRRHATQVPVDRPAAWGDVVIADVSGRIAGEEDTFMEDENAEIPLQEGQEILVPGLAEAFAGLRKGEQRSLELVMPEDFRAERFQGKTATFTIAMKEVKEVQLPAEDGELAALVNAEEFDSFEALRTRIHEDLEKSLATNVEAAHRQAALDKVVEGATIEYPRVLVDREIDHIINEVTGSDRQAYAAHLQRIGRSEEEYRETFREAAEARLRRGLVLARVVEAEAIESSPEDIDGEVER
ncbi:MAG: trigger factor, partial [Tepidiformaceae bacterium]